MRELEYLCDLGPHRRQPQGALHSACARVAAHECADAGAVDRGHVGEIDDEVAIPVSDQPLELLLEGLGGAAAHERLPR